MFPSCRIEERMAQTAEIWSACRPMVLKQRSRSWKSCLSCLPFRSQEPPLGKTEDKIKGGKTTQTRQTFSSQHLLGLSSNRSQQLAGRVPACPSRSCLLTAHRTHGSSSPLWPTRQKNKNGCASKSTHLLSALNRDLLTTLNEIAVNWIKGCACFSGFNGTKTPQTTEEMGGCWQMWGQNGGKEEARLEAWGLYF